MKKEKYIIVGSNNFWYTTTEPVTPEELKAEIETIKAGIKKDDYEHDENPIKLFALVITGEEETFEL